MSSHRVSTAKRQLRYACVGALLALAACGGSKSESTDSSTNDTVNAVDASPSNDGSLADFCTAARDNQGGADIADTDDPAKIAEKLSTNAETLAAIAKQGPTEVKADAQAVADAAQKMAEAITADPTLEKFNTLIADFAASDANSASQRVQTWVTDNCEAGQS